MARKAFWIGTTLSGEILVYCDLNASPEQVRKDWLRIQAEVAKVWEADGVSADDFK